MRVEGVDSDALRAELMKAWSGVAVETAAFCPSSPATRAAVSTPRASTDRMRPSSSARMPAIVHPAGVVTSSFSAAG